MFIKILSKKCLAITLLLLSTSLTVANSSEPILLSNSNNSFGIERFRIDPSGDYVIFNEFDQVGVLNRFSRNINNPNIFYSLRTDLSSTEDFFAFDPDNSRIISIDDTNNGLSSTSLDGQSSFLLSSPNNDPVRSFSGSNDNSDFQLFRTTDNTLYSIKSDGSNTAISLSSSLVVDRFSTSSNRQTVVFSAETSENNQTIFSIPIDGSSEAIPIHILPENSDLDRRRGFSIDSNRFIYIVETFFENGTTTLQLYSTAVDGSSAPVALGNAINGASINIDFQLSNDGEFIVFLLQGLSDSELRFDQLFAVPIDGSSQPIEIDSFTSISSFQITNDSQTILYTETTTEPQVGSTTRLYTSPIDASTTPINIVPNDDFEFSVSPSFPRFQTSEDSEFVFYVARNLTTFSTLIYSAKVDGSEGSTLLSPNGEFQADSFVVDSKNSRVIFTTGTFGNVTNYLLSVGFDGSNFSTLLSVIGVIDDIELTSNSDYIIFGQSAIAQTFDPDSLFALDVSIEVTDEICFPVKTQNGTFTTICF